MKSSFEKTINWNKYLWRKKKIKRNLIFRFLNWSKFSVKRLFVLTFENNANRKAQTECFFPRVEIDNYNVMIDEQYFFDQPVINDLRKFEIIPKVASGQGDDYAIDYLLDYAYFKENYKTIAIDLSNNKHLMLIWKQISKLILLGT